MNYKTRRMLYLIATGYTDDAAQLAREIATETLNDMGRRKCEWTGNDYFFRCCED